MTAPLLWVSEADLVGAHPDQVVTVTGPEAHHAVTVRRLTVGEAVLLADGAGTLAQATITEIARGVLAASVRAVTVEPIPDPRFVLVQALAKGGRDEQAVEAATELGVDEVIPWEADRSIVQWRPDRVARARQRWVDTVAAAAKQARRARVPQVGDLVRGAQVADLVSAATLALVLHEQAGHRLAGTTLPGSGTVLVVVGPEGGISPAELAASQAAGAVAVRLGSLVLRSSSAGPAALAVLNASGRWH